MMGAAWWKGSPHSLLVGLQIGTGIMEINVENSQTAEISLPWLSSSTRWHAHKTQHCTIDTFLLSHSHCCPILTARSPFLFQDIPHYLSYWLCFLLLEETEATMKKMNLLLSSCKHVTAHSLTHCAASSPGPCLAWLYSGSGLPCSGASPCLCSLTQRFSCCHSASPPSCLHEDNCAFFKKNCLCNP